MVEGASLYGSTESVRVGRVRSQVTYTFVGIAVVALCAACLLIVLVANSNQNDGTELASQTITSNARADIAALKVTTRKEHAMDRQASKYIDMVSGTQHRNSFAYRFKKIAEKEQEVKSEEAKEISKLQSREAREIAETEKESNDELRKLQKDDAILKLKQKIHNIRSQH